MRLTELTLRNYRRFEEFYTDLHPNLTVIAARNGQGKTTVLDGAAAALGPFVGAFDEGRSENIRLEDSRYRRLGGGPENEQTFPVVVEAAATDPEMRWSRHRNSAKGRTTTKDSAPLAALGHRLQDSARHDEQTMLPVIAYYSSKRLWEHHSNTSGKAVLTQSRTAGYEDALSARSSYKQVQQWVRSATLADLQLRDQPDHAVAGLGVRLRGIARAVDTVMHHEGWSGFRYSWVFDELAMTHPDHGELPMSVLSDGVRAMAALTADLALRCTRLNGYLGEEAPLETPGIALIDEVDLHLHPSWQQRVVGDLQAAFPRVQWIVTTHSPQVLSSVKSENIRVLSRDPNGRWRSAAPVREVVGLASSFALLEAMDVNPIPDLAISEKVDEYTAYIERGEYEAAAARALRDELDEVYGPQHQVLVDADRLIRFQRFKLRRDSGAASTNGAD